MSLRIDSWSWKVGLPLRACMSRSETVFAKSLLGILVGGSTGSQGNWSEMGL